MAHFAELDENNNVIWVTVVDNNELLVDGVESEAKGIEFLQHLGPFRRWVQTSYNTVGGVNTAGGTPLRKNYAGLGFKYDETLDAFIPPAPPYPSWSLNEDTCVWEPPVPHPDDTENAYEWDEGTVSWVKFRQAP
jgi:hypothetical protein